MRMRLASVLIVCLGLGVLVVCPRGSCLADEDELSKIREAHQRREAMIQSVHFLYKYNSIQTQGGEPTEIEEEWYFEGNKLLRILSQTKPGQPKVVLNWQSTDGNWNYDCIFWRDEPGKLQTVMRKPANPQELRNRCPLLQNSGHSLSGFEETLGTLLRREECEVIAGDNYIKNGNCVRVRMGTVNSPKGIPHSVNVWFDRTADYFPGYILIATEQLTDKILHHTSGRYVFADGELSFTSRVADFQDWQDGATNVSIRFPLHTGIDAFRRTYVILSVNQPLPPSRLIPQMDRGVEIITHPNTPRQSSQVVGGETDAQEHFARSLTSIAVEQGSAAHKLTQHAPLAVAEPRSLFSRPTIWMGFAGVLLSVFVIVWRVRAR